MIFNPHALTNLGTVIISTNYSIPPVSPGSRWDKIAECFTPDISYQPTPLYDEENL
jgi:hypothetical protein